MKGMTFFMPVALILVGINGLAQQPNKWGTVEATYTIGSSKLVPKDQGSLEILLNLTCVDKASDLSHGISDLVLRLNQVVKQESNYLFNSVNPEISVSSQNQYVIKYDPADPQGLNPYYVDFCKDNAKVNVGTSAIDLTKKFFTASATIKIETKKSLSELSILRQKLQQFAEALNKEDVHKQVTVENEVLVVSAEQNKEVISSLNDQNRLTGNSAKRSRMNLDEALSGGFSELFITSVTTNIDQYAEYAQYKPELTENGKSRITVPYTFSIQYIPKNIANTQNVPWSGPEHGNLSQQFNGVVEVDTDYYVAQLNLKTLCQPSKTAAAEALNGVFGHFKKLAEAVVTPTQNNPYERLEENVGTPNQDGQWQTWERFSNQESPGIRGSVKSFISLCDGHIVGQVKEANQTYTVSHNLRLVTKNFAALQQLAQAANLYTERQRNSAGSQRVEVELSQITPHLKDAKQFEVVDVLAYRSALDQLIDPQGAVAKKLLDEIQAGEAYYTATRGHVYAARERMGMAPAMAMAKSAPGGGSADSSYDVVITNDANIPLSEIRVSQTYKVVYRPNRDLVSILKEVRNSQSSTARP